jgi:hypothetical protein
MSLITVSSLYAWSPSQSLATKPVSNENMLQLYPATSFTNINSTTSAKAAPVTSRVHEALFSLSHPEAAAPSNATNSLILLTDIQALIPQKTRPIRQHTSLALLTYAGSQPSDPVY